MLNNITIQGRLTAEPQLRTTPNGHSVLNFCVACERPVKKGEQSEADFVDCVAWRICADFVAKFFHKGDLILLNGRLQTRSYEDANGSKRKAVEVLVNEVEFCGAKRNNEANTPADPAHTPAPVPATAIEEASDVLPFDF